LVFVVRQDTFDEDVMNNESQGECAGAVDIIIPVFNQARYVEALLESLGEANNATPVEIIVIDDGSTERATLELLKSYDERGVITLVRNQANIGFTRTANRGMALHTDRDVVLLNSDTIVHGDWLDRMVACAYSGSKIASVNPLTSQYGSHISCYPSLTNKFDGDLELSGKELGEICARLNDRRYVDVPTTVGFCMYIRRQSLRDVGFFDATHFPVAYGEETDFCYRAGKAGWRHRVAGDAYVEHFEGKSFGGQKQELKRSMVSALARLHPDLMDCDQRFARQDPLRPLRKQVDLGRLCRLLAGASDIRVLLDREYVEIHDRVSLVLDAEKRTVSFTSELGYQSLPNIGTFELPKDIADFNRVLRILGITCLFCDNDSVLGKLQSLVAGQPYEMGLAARILVATEGAGPVSDI
jgi:GT2 family glycosyltransferase